VFGSATSWLQHELLDLHGPLVYVAIGGLVFIEVGIVIGFFVPGEIATIIGGVVASDHRANLVVMIIVVCGAATIGNISGYELGRVAGPWLLSHRPLQGHPSVARAQRLVARRGGPAVVIGRWIVVVRALLPGVAGMSAMNRRTFALMSAAGGFAWGTMWVLIGFSVGVSYTEASNVAGEWSLVGLGLVVAAFLAFVVRRKVRERRRHGERDELG
jgi:membrane-associated protein